MLFTQTHFSSSCCVPETHVPYDRNPCNWNENLSFREGRWLSGWEQQGTVWGAERKRGPSDPQPEGGAALGAEEGEGSRRRGGGAGAEVSRGSPAPKPEQGGQTQSIFTGLQGACPRADIGLHTLESLFFLEAQRG